MYLKIHKSYRNVVALCDAELIGKKFEEGNMQLYLRENFYKDKKVIGSLWCLFSTFTPVLWYNYNKLI